MPRLPIRGPMRVVAQGGGLGHQPLAVELGVAAPATAAPWSASQAAFACWWPAACGYGTRIEATPTAATSAQVDEPARPSTRSPATRASAIRSVRKAMGSVSVCAGRLRQPLAIASAAGHARVAGQVERRPVLEQPLERRLQRRP